MRGHKSSGDVTDHLFMPLYMITCSRNQYLLKVLILERIRRLEIPSEILWAQELNLSASILLLNSTGKSSFTFYFFHMLLTLLSISLLIWWFDKKRQTAFASSLSFFLSIYLIKMSESIVKEWLVCMGINSGEFWYISFSFVGDGEIYMQQGLGPTNKALPCHQITNDLLMFVT